MTGRLSLAVCAALALTAPAFASPGLVAGKSAPPLPAWTAYCAKNPAECRIDRREPETVAATPELIDLIEAVNATSTAPSSRSPTSPIAASSTSGSCRATARAIARISSF